MVLLIGYIFSQEKQYIIKRSGITINIAAMLTSSLYTMVGLILSHNVNDGIIISTQRMIKVFLCNVHEFELTMKMRRGTKRRLEIN